MTIVKTSLSDAKPLTKAEIKKFKARKDEDIDFSDIPELDDRFWKNARVVMPNSKEKVSIRLDKDVLEWFRSQQARGYQSRINAVLKAFVEAQQSRQ
ncbi:MAG: BrnA antitoxin family protein [Robiginitomaculum sp.]|nr:BrnA antitoxin family protein [Robiginitomaculum sp.]